MIKAADDLARRLHLPHLAQAHVGVLRLVFPVLARLVRLAHALIRVVVLDKVDAIQLAMLVDHVVAFELLGFALLLVVLEVADLLLQLVVVEVLRVPVRDLVELEQVTELHFLLSVLLLLAA